MNSKSIFMVSSLLACSFVTILVHARPPKPPASVRLYVMDCGRLTVQDPSRFNFKKQELAVLDLAVGCYLIVHPKGTLIWDTGVVPDHTFTPNGGVKEYATATMPLKTQLAEIGYIPAEIKYLALSHYHWDHAGNAAEFAASTWLITKVEHDALFSTALPPRTDASMFAPLKDSKTILLPNQDYDVFGDGEVVIKPAPGHTPGHRVLLVKLKRTGPVVLSGDLYHYPEELTTHRIMNGEFDAQQTAASREAVQTFLKQSGAQLWIQHDLGAFRKLKKSPAYYE